MSRPTLIAIALCVPAVTCSCTQESTQHGQSRPPDWHISSHTNYHRPDDIIEGVWRSDANRENRLFLGADRWSLFKLEPERLVIDGRFNFDNVASTDRFIVVSLADTKTQYSWQQPLVASYDGMKLRINIDDGKLTIATYEQATCELLGSYTYAGDDSPVKGMSTVREWGEYLRNKGMKPSPQ